MGSLANTWAGYAALISFLLAYTLVVFEEKIHMRKSKPVVLIGCVMWAIIGIYEASHGGGHAHDYIKELIAEIGELFFFLLVAMTYINTLDERNVFKDILNGRECLFIEQPNRHGYTSYNAVDNAEVVIGMGSTLTYESAARGNKTAFFYIVDALFRNEPGARYGYPEKVPDVGPYLLLPQQD